MGHLLQPRGAGEARSVHTREGPGSIPGRGEIKIGIYLLMYVASVHLAVSRYGL